MPIVLIKTKASGNPGYILAIIPICISKIIKAKQEMAWSFFSFPLKRSNIYPIRMIKKAKNYHAQEGQHGFKMLSNTIRIGPIFCCDFHGKDTF
jgi:hypothetical protein